MGAFSAEPATPNNMRRIFLSSLLCAFVLGLPRDILEYDNDSKNNSSNALDEADYPDDEGESSDNCALAVPLYYPLRRSESYFKGIRGDIIWEANSEANYIEQRIQRRSEVDRDFRFWSLFRYPLDAELAYKSAIATGSRLYLEYTDMFHSFISWGDYSDSYDAENFRSWRYRPLLYGPLFIFADGEKGLDELVSNISEDRNRNRNQNTMKNVAKLIKPDTWPYLASCLYETFKENQDSSSLGQVITDLVADEDFEKFNRYFERYVGDISKALKNVLQSEETLEMVQLIYELSKSEIKAINYNYLQPTLYYSVLQLKTVLMKPDFNELWTALNQTDYFVKESLRKFNTGRWPEMGRFVDNFLRRTAGSIVFWDRLTGSFITEVKSEVPGLLDWMKNNDLDIENVDVDPIFEKLTSIMSMIADGDEASIRQLFKNIRDSRWDETITYYIEIIGDHLTSCNLATLASYLPSYDDIKSTVTNNDFFQLIKTLLFKDWPQDEIYPASIEDFVRRIYDTRLPIFSDVFGSSCDGKAPRHT